LLVVANSGNFSLLYYYYKLPGRGIRRITVAVWCSKLSYQSTLSYLRSTAKETSRFRLEINKEEVPVVITVVGQESALVALNSLKTKVLEKILNIINC
jgi:hypothetical protein